MQEVSAVEDPDLLEVALAGPDTSQRLKLLPRIKRETVDVAPVARRLAEGHRQLGRGGLTFDPETMRLEPAARLKVTFTERRHDSDPCDPQATGGYLGATIS